MHYIVRLDEFSSSCPSYYNAFTVPISTVIVGIHTTDSSPPFGVVISAVTFLHCQIETDFVTTDQCEPGIRLRNEVESYWYKHVGTISQWMANTNRRGGREGDYIFTATPFPNQSNKQGGGGDRLTYGKNFSLFH